MIKSINESISSFSHAHYSMVEQW